MILSQLFYLQFNRCKNEEYISYVRILSCVPPRELCISPHFQIRQDDYLIVGAACKPSGLKEIPANELAFLRPLQNKQQIYHIHAGMEKKTRTF